MYDDQMIGERSHNAMHKPTCTCIWAKLYHNFLITYLYSASSSEADNRRCCSNGKNPR